MSQQFPWCLVQTDTQNPSLQTQHIRHDLLWKSRVIWNALIDVLRAARPSEFQRNGNIPLCMDLASISDYRSWRFNIFLKEPFQSITSVLFAKISVYGWPQKCSLPLPSKTFLQRSQKNLFCKGFSNVKMRRRQALEKENIETGKQPFDDRWHLFQKDINENYYLIL